MAKVEMIALAHFYSEGSRGRSGGAPSNDKVWGIARIQGTLVNFWGRRGGVLKFKTHVDGLLPVAQKLAEKTRKGYRAMTPTSTLARSLCPGLEAQVSSYFYSAMSRGTLNTAH